MPIKVDISDIAVNGTTVYTRSCDESRRLTAGAIIYCEIRCSYLRVIPLMMKRHAVNSKILLKSVNDFVPIIYTFLDRFRQYSVLEICPNRY